MQRPAFYSHQRPDNPTTAAWYGRKYAELAGTSGPAALKKPTSRSAFFSIQLFLKQHGKPMLLKQVLLVHHGATLVRTAVRAHAMRELEFAALRALHQSRSFEFKMGATHAFSGFGSSMLWYRHSRTPPLQITVHNLTASCRLKASLAEWKAEGPLYVFRIRTTRGFGWFHTSGTAPGNPVCTADEIQSSN